MLAWLRGGCTFRALREGGRTFPRVSRGGVEVFSRTRAEISQPPLPVINDHSLMAGEGQCKYGGGAKIIVRKLRGGGGQI